MKLANRRVFGLAVVGAVVAPVGCFRSNDRLAEVKVAGPEVEGRVVVQGIATGESPLAGGRLRFRLVNDPSAPLGVAVIDSDGRFRAATPRLGDPESGLRPGIYQVWIEPPKADRSEPMLVVPGKYLDPRTSGLTLSVPAQEPITFVVDSLRPR